MNGKKTALITGASTGIGYQLTRLFARDGHDLVLVARNKSKLEVLSKEMNTAYGTDIRIIPKDLSQRGSAVEVAEELTASGISIDVLVNNAGAGCCGLFHEMELNRILEMVELNITSLSILTKLIAETMITNGGGRILNVASTGAYQPGPYIAVYYATKAYVLSLSEAISNEMKPFGIRVSVLCPGATRTEFSKRAGKTDLTNAMDAATVAEIAYKGLMRGKRLIIPGGGNKFGIALSKILPGNILASVIGKAQHKHFDEYQRVGGK